MKKEILYPLTGAAIFLTDQWMKHYVEKNLRMGQKRKLSNRLELRRIHNPGICLGILSGKPEKVKKLAQTGTGIVTAMQLAALLGSENKVKKAGLTLTVAGAWSNLVDRLRGQEVVDYIGIKTGKKKTDQVTYNLGDFAIGAGGILWVLGSMTE